MKAILVASVLISVFGVALSGLSGVATTTRYTLARGHKDACGCTTMYNQKYTAAASFPIFGKGTTWCGSGCGRCFKLTSQDRPPAPDAGRGGKGSIVVMITDCCPDAGWCDSPNRFGYTYHFDLNDGDGQIQALGWDNTMVNFEEVSCSSQQTNLMNQCECKKKKFFDEFLSNDEPLDIAAVVTENI